MEVKVKAIAGFKASVEAVGASTTIKAIVSVENTRNFRAFRRYQHQLSDYR